MFERTVSRVKEWSGRPLSTKNRYETPLVRVVQCLVLVCTVATCPSPRAVAREPGDPPESAKTSGPGQGPAANELSLDLDRTLIKDRIRSFMPPLLRGSTPMHAFTLPPGAVEVGVTARFLTVEGTDFFAGYEKNLAVFRNSRIERQLFDLSISRGFDLRRKYLRNFTSVLNIPFVSSKVEGSFHPNVIALIDIIDPASTQAVGDISLILKKKIVDQANFPVGLAIAAGVFFPTGSNDEKFGQIGEVAVLAPPLPDGPPVPEVPIVMGPWMFSPPKLGPYPFNDGIFDRFADDGRLPSVLQPGDGAASFLVGGFLTHQFLPGDLRLFNRAALHVGMTYRFRQSADGVDRGDVTTRQVSFAFPIRRDHLALEVGYLGFHQSEDRYDGTFIAPFFTDAEGNIMGGMGSHLTFKEVPRPPYVDGEWGNLLTSLIVSPDPQIRFVATVLTRVVKPKLGPAPPYVFRFSMQSVF